MTERADLLLEIGTEELPPKALAPLALALKTNVIAGLEKAKITCETSEYFAAPRRLAVLINVAIQQPDITIERRGPAVAKAFDAQGKPTAAATGFAKTCNTTVDKLEKRKTAKGEWLFFTGQQTGKQTSELVPDIINQAVKQLPIPKPMRWGKHNIEFIRPVHWVVLLLDKDVIPATILGQTTDQHTYGHRFLHPDEIKIKQASDYPDVLPKKGFVEADYAKRRHTIQQQINDIATKFNAHIIDRPGLLDEVTGLVEWPVALYGRFDQRFLNLPEEVLILTLEKHQKSFAMRSNNRKRIVPCFITISNIESSNPQQVITGNERVVHARLSDAEFFFEQDCKTLLADHLEQLQSIVYEQKLGSLYDKSQRISRLAKHIAEHIQTDVKKSARAGLLCKCDLVTEMVGEFPELQGIMGYYYSIQKEGEQIAIAIRDYYCPRFAGDQLPQTDIGATVALADKLDSLVGIIAIKGLPSGDKDPFALRRAALGIVRIIIEAGYDTLDLTELVEAAYKQYKSLLTDNKVTKSVVEFIVERLRYWYSEQAIPADVYLAVKATNITNLVDFDQRIKAIDQFKKSPAAGTLIEANKRVKNMLLKNKVATKNLAINTTLFEHEAEKALANAVKNLAKQNGQDYHATLQRLAGLKQPVDDFFDNVMVMHEDTKIRNNRLALLAELRHLFLQIADISLLQE